jgi:hypothetical protein
MFRGPGSAFAYRLAIKIYKFPDFDFLAGENQTHQFSDLVFSDFKSGIPITSDPLCF